MRAMVTILGRIARMCTFLAAALGLDRSEVDGRYRTDQLHWLSLDQTSALHVPAGTL